MTFAALLKICWDKDSVELCRWMIPSISGSSVRERQDGREGEGREGEAALIERKRERWEGRRDRWEG